MTDARFLTTQSEIRHLFDGLTIREQDTHAQARFVDYVYYKADNFIAADKLATFKSLSVVAAIVVFVQGALWKVLGHAQGVMTGVFVFGADNWMDAFYLSVQVLISAGYDSSIAGETVLAHFLRTLFCLMIISGLIVFAMLMGFINDSVSNSLNSLGEGRSKVTRSGHTLLLGWNESTLRVLSQIATLRKQHYDLNSGWSYQCGCRRRVPPASSLATSDIVIVANKLSKEEMNNLLRAHFGLGDVGRRTKVGSNVVCRIGDPTIIRDLVRAGVKRAAAILVMMTDYDFEEEKLSDGKVHNGATIRTMLALRAILLSNAVSLRKDFRIVFQLSHQSESVTPSSFPSPDGGQIIYPLSMTDFLNSLMFLCLTQPSIAMVIMELLDANGAAIRKRKVSEVTGRKRPDEVVGNLFSQRGRMMSLVDLTFKEAQQRVDNCVLIGVVKSSSTSLKSRVSAAQKLPADGLAPDPNSILGKNDTLVYIGQKAMPDFDMTRRSAPNVRAKEVQRSDPKSPRRIMILGWRPQWNDSDKILVSHLRLILSSLSPGSIVALVNEVPLDQFAELVELLGGGIERIPDEDGGAKQSWNSYRRDGVTIFHQSGDPASIRVVRPLVQCVDFDTAIVLASVGGHLAARSRDTRVLVIMLQLRHLVEEYGKPSIYIISENEFDYTAKIAPVPLSALGHKALDFVNTQSITARFLAQVLANPMLGSALEELFEDTPGKPNIRLIPAGSMFELDGLPLTFADVLYAVSQQAEQSNGLKSVICIGYTTTHDEVLKPHVLEIVLGPSKSKVWTYTEDDFLICIVRDLEELNETVTPAVTHRADIANRNGVRL